MDEMIITIGPFPPRYLRTYMLTSMEIIENMSNDPVSMSRGKNLIWLWELLSMEYPIFPGYQPKTRYVGHIRDIIQARYVETARDHPHEVARQMA